jgi:hypothetical protein
MDDEKHEMKEPPLGVGENFVELPSNRAFAGRVSLALDVGGILKQGQHAVLAVLGESVQVEKFVVGGRGIDFEIAGVNDDAERCMDRRAPRSPPGCASREWDER